MTEELTDQEFGHICEGSWLGGKDGWRAAIDEVLAERTADLRCRLAAAEIKLRAARMALAACAEVREARASE